MKKLYLDSELIGKKFNRLTILSIVRKPEGKTGKIQRFAHCKCECGNEKDVRVMSLVTGNTKSCGCLAIETSSKHRLSQDPLFITLKSAIRRCYNSKEKSYVNYGARGIKVCEEWMNDPKKFIQWSLENGYEKGLTIDRIDVNGDYTPSNCRWINHHLQNVNRRIQKNNTSGYEGVAFHKVNNCWHCYITVNRIRIGIGYFTSKKDALDARNKYIIDHDLTEYKIQKWKGE